MFKVISGVGSRMLAGFTGLVVGGLGIFSVAQAESVLRVIPHANLKNLDPIWTTAYISRNHGYMIHYLLWTRALHLSRKW